MMPLGQQLARRKPIVFQRQHREGEELARNLGTFQLMMFGVGATIGTGIFFVLSEQVPVAGPAVVLSFIIAAVVTPPDVTSQILLAVPMCVLYELGIFAARFVAPRDQPTEQQS